MRRLYLAAAAARCHLDQCVWEAGTRVTMSDMGNGRPPRGLRVVCALSCARLLHFPGRRCIFRMGLKTKTNRLLDGGMG